MNTRQFRTVGSVDVQESIELEECHTDPIHRTASIQPHGLFLQFDAETLDLLAASQNVPDQLPGHTVEELLDASLTEVLPPTSVERVRSDLRRTSERPTRWSAELDGGPAVLSLFPLGDEGTRGLEVESFDETPTATNREFDRNQVLNNLGKLSERRRIFDQTVKAIRDQTSFDRVMLYRFNAEGHGEVVAESRQQGMGSYLGQQFPASDIPEPARRIYRKTDFRSIPRVDYEPVPVITPSGPARDLDLTYSCLRNVPRVHRQYLQNMRVASSFSVPVLSEGELWGLIACHGQSSNRLSWPLRLFCSNLTSILSSQIDRLKARKTRQHRQEITNLRSRFLRNSGKPDQLFDVVSEFSRELLEALDARGFYLARGDESTWLSEPAVTPPRDRILQWIQDQLKQEKVLTVSCLEEEFDENWEHSGEISGLLAIRLTVSPGDFCAWFRAEQERKISWGGDPRKPVAIDDSGQLNPRNSFEEWTQIVAGTCKRWSERDTWAAEEIVHAFNQVSLREQHQRIQKINEELQAANQQKDQLMQELHHRVKNNFQVTLSLINIHKNQVEDPAARDLLEKLRTKLHSLVRLHETLSIGEQYDRVNMARYMEDLVENLQSSASGTEQEVVLETNLEEVILGIGQALPCALIVNELVSNALEHGLPPEGPAEIEVSLRRLDDGTCELSVRDNGSGFPDSFEELADRSLGLKIVRSLGEAQLRGTVSTANQNGAAIRIKFQPDL